MMDLVYLSGTGHSWQAAQWWLEEAEKAGLATRMVPFKEAAADKQIAAEIRSRWLGLFYPVYGFSPPWLFLIWLCRLPRGKSRPVFLLNTRGAVKSGRQILWGISGTALWLPWLLLVLKGYRVKGLAAMEAPSNWVAAHPGPSRETAEFMLGRGRLVIQSMSEAIFSGRNYFQARLFLAAPIDFLCGLFGLTYLLAGRMALAKLFVASPACNLCGRCATECPSGSIELCPEPYWRSSCLSCLRCLNSCPKKAIYPAHLPLLIGLAAGAAFLAINGFSWFNLLAAVAVFTAVIPAIYPLIRRLARRYELGRLISLSTHWPWYSWWNK